MKFNLFKNTGLSSDKLLIIGIIIILVVIVFIIINAVEYNLNLLSNDIKEDFMVSNVVNINNPGVIIKKIYFNDDNIIGVNNSNDTAQIPIIYYEGVNDDIIINKIEFTSTKPINEDLQIKILNTNTLQIIRTILIPKDDIIQKINNISPVTSSTSPVTSSTSPVTSSGGNLNNDTFANTDLYKYSINNTINLALDFNSSYILSFFINNNEKLNNPVFLFKVGDGRFRFNNKLIGESNGVSIIDNLNIKLYTNNNLIDIPRNTFELEQFNKLKLVIEKPNFEEMKKHVAKISLANNTSFVNQIMDSFNKFMPINIMVYIKDITKIGDDTLILKPTYKLPEPLAFCVSNKSKTDNFYKKGCILELYNLLSGHSYELKLKLIYSQSDNINNMRESKELKKTITIKTNDKNDLLSKSLESRKNNDFTKDMLKILSETGNFNKYQDTQNNQMITIENNMSKLMEQYNL